ncbi:Hypothetical protein SRAE_0000058500 [Strongyloides ratti]|uniref:Uncharacterized protein n=1 Tax=Strongyloides ratti TaxID=34506 RepID=A0A090KVL1_STRRB|nr:Hypothetical protein SRAE_0000058500 [Strongyloides ratti]CEF61461.1 Hypothetical protein SRAE_0000058500 [Strongyloides ratti]
MFLSSNGCYLRCNGYVRRIPPCRLFISLERDQFLIRASGVLNPQVRHQLYSMQRNYRLRSSFKSRMNSFTQANFDQTTAKRICYIYRVACKYPTYIKLY